MSFLKLILDLNEIPIKISTDNFLFFDTKYSINIIC